MIHLPGIQDSPGNPGQLVLGLIALETRAARVEGAFAADPEMGTAWRAQVMLSEACRSVGLEDIHVLEGDMIMRQMENRATTSELARGVEAAQGLVRFMRAPGDLRADPERVIRRARAAAVRVMPGEERPLDSLPLDLPPILADAPSPFLGALKCAARFRVGTMARAPSAERLVFMAADHALRAPAAGQGGAHWVFLPSMALSQDRFHAWSPASRAGMQALMAGLDAELSRALGSFATFRRWRAMAREIAGGKHGKSRLRDLVELCLSEPILTSRVIRERLGVSERAALYLAREAEDEGILEPVTPRRSHRLWATPRMAQQLRRRVAGSVRHRGRAGERAAAPAPEAGAPPGEAPPPLDEDWRERETRALDDLDAAMARADALLAKYRSPEGGARGG